MKGGKDMLDARFCIGDNVSVKCFDTKKHSIYFYKILSISNKKYHCIDMISHRKKDFSIKHLDLAGNLESNIVDTTRIPLNL